MPHSTTVKTVIHHYYPFLKPIPYLSDKAIKQWTICRWSKELEDRTSDAPSISLQRRIRREEMNELVEIES